LESVGLEVENLEFGKFFKILNCVESLEMKVKDIVEVGSGVINPVVRFKELLEVFLGDLWSISVGHG